MAAAFINSKTLICAYFSLHDMKMNAATDELVTKSHFDSKLAELELRLTVRMGGMIAVATAVLLAFDKFL